MTADMTHQELPSAPGVEHRFNTPPGWPPTAEGWRPAPGWTADPSWPTAPEGWPWWVIPVAGAPSPHWYSKRWPQLVGVAVLALAIGVAIGASGTSQANGRAAAAEKAARAAKQGTVQAQAAATTSQQQADTADSRAEANLQSQKDSLAATYKSALDDLVAREAAVSSREKAVGGAEVAAKANSFAGAGTYLVGTDIMPGTYRAAANTGCYWARLSSLNTSDIIDNNNADGPVVLEVRSTDKALEVSGCAEFHKVG